MLALRVPRSEVSSVLGDAWIIAGEIGAEPLTETIRGLATIARLDLPSSSGATLGSDSPIEPQTDDEVIDPFGLTAREREVLALLADGQTNRRIADTLFISESTASVHVSNIIGKLGVANRVEAAAVAVRSGLAR
jgi:DNA-binding NarL/FixJ family response regulator